MLRVIVVLTGVFTSVLGLSVLIGWHTHNAGLIQVLPSLIPMQYNTAICFVLSGLGLITLSFSMKRLTMSLAVVVGLISLISLLEYMLGVNFGLDELFMDHYILTHVTFPGRMAQTTAICFLLTSGALLFASAGIFHAQRLLVLGILCSLIFAVGAATLFVYIAGFDKPAPFGSVSTTYMAVHTSVGFTMLGMGLFLYILRQSDLMSDSRRWLPVTVFLATLLLASGLWNVMKINESEGITQAVKRNANSIEIVLTEEIVSYGKIVDRMANRWRSQGDISREDWQSDVDIILDSDSTILALVYIDPSFRIRWIESGDRIAFDRELKPEFLKKIQPVIEGATENRQVMAKYIGGIPTESGSLMLVSPAYSKGEFSGLVLEIIDLHEKLANLLSRKRISNFAYEFSDSGDVIYSDSDTEQQLYKRFAGERDFDLYGENWRLRVFPTASLLSTFQTPIPNVILIFGIVVAVLLPLTILLYQKGGIRAKELQVTNTKLEKEIVKRRETETHFRRVIENSPDAVVLTDAEGKILLTNQQTEKLFGYSGEELIGNAVEMLMPEPLRGGHLSHRKHYHSNPVVRPMGEGYNLYGLKKDGSLIAVEISLSPLETDEGTQALATIRDITERKRRDDRLRESEERFRGAFEYSGIGMALVNPDGGWMKVNTALCNMVGYSQKELLATDFQTITYPDDLDTDLVFVKRLLSGEIKMYTMEKRYVHKQGHTVWILLTVSLVHDSQGKPLYFISQIQDITERKRAERALNESLAQLSQKSKHESVISDVTRSIHSSIKLDEVLENTVQSIHKHLTEAESIAVYIVEGNIAKLRAHAGLAEWFVERVKEIPRPRGVTWKTVIEGCQNYCQDTANDNTIGPAGRELGIKSYASMPIRYKEKTIGTINIVSKKIESFKPDDLKLLEIIARQIEVAVYNAKQAEELERSNKELEQFAYIASHDLKEPLRMVSSYLQLLERRYKDKLDQDANEFIEYAVEGAKRMQSLINDLLMFSRITTRGEHFKSASLEAALGNAVSNLEIAIEESGAVVTHDPLPDMEVDISQITQLFQNLIGNGIKYRDGDLPRIHIGAEEKNGVWLFSVKDNGIGIDPKYFERIFVIFQRLHTRDKYEGTGMGLAMCKKIVERHNGHIWVESEPGKGSVFYFTMQN